MNNKQSIAPRIDDFQQVSSTSQGTVRSTWSGQDGWDRKRQIEEARLAVIAEQQKREQEQQPLNLRIAALEGEVMRMKAQLKELTDAS